MGAGYGIRPFLNRPSLGGALVIEYSVQLMRATLERFDLAPILSDGRIRLLIDPDEASLSKALLESYVPI
jgi:hypothetical protein